MSDLTEENRAGVAIFLAVVALLAALAGQLGYRQAVDQLARRGMSDMALAADSLTSQMQTYRELAVLMADHPVLEDLDSPAARAAAQEVLRTVADKTSALDLVFADAGGAIVVSASGAGGDLATAADFRRAMQGALGDAHGRRGREARREWSFAAPVFAPGGRIRGAVVVTVDVDDLEEDWRGGRAPVYFVDADGMVFITNRSELLFWEQVPGTPGLQPPNGPVPQTRARDVGGHEVWRMGWSPYVPRHALHLAQPLPVIGLTANILVDLAPARRLALTQGAAVAAICLAFGLMLKLATERRRALALANAKLETRVAARTRALTQANARLRREVAEREEAEAALKRAQAELIQAGKLSALGQMSAGISHELNQPLMAIRQFAENGAAFLDRDRPDMARGNLDKISALAQRAARIIRNLRAFARNESEPMSRVDVVQVINAAVEMTEARLTRDAVRLDWTPPQAPVPVRGGEVRLVQVFVNLITNAADAMMAQEDRAIAITLEQGARISVRLRDIGPGIADPDRIFEPFYTTREVGSDEGLGLGLSISYGLVQSFGGDIRGANADGGGAVFTVELESWDEPGATGEAA
ncbi:sensor histidine kinase [Marinibacterium profundimaris]|uniref:C4-dicarboxylate transport sensor protein DctB n=1 Tax=Marinibacterium profundimaris TaxID=1679460 RepID=A0A225NXB8_9RHOB|nr:ATP-binding protein [Marinibacterium profundimaris]OWU77838.1 C4-dicarboxylate ABC transporter [Marinibacterium profundimaris]